LKRKKARSQGSSLLPIALIGGGVLLILGVLIWQAVSNTSAASPTPTTAQAQQENIPYPEISRISIQDSRQALDQKQAVILDVRDSGSFSKGHIPGAINIPLTDLPNRTDELDPNDWIITYCT
jgi:3-mercaptopyruvate sulfurtransferase SseA